MEVKIEHIIPPPTFTPRSITITVTTKEELDVLTSLFGLNLTIPSSLPITPAQRDMLSEVFHQAYYGLKAEPSQEA